MPLKAITNIQSGWYCKQRKTTTQVGLLCLRTRRKSDMNSPKTEQNPCVTTRLQWATNVGPYCRLLEALMWPQARSHHRFSFALHPWHIIASPAG
eukprot:4579465-Amphidinium_carterae.1